MPTIESIKALMSRPTPAPVTPDMLAEMEPEMPEGEPTPEDESEPEDMPDEPMPEAPVPVAKYKEGDMVRSADPMRPYGKVVGAPIKDGFAYRVQCAGGIEYMETESALEPMTMEDASMADTNANAAQVLRNVAVALGLGEDADGDQIVAGIDSIKAERDSAIDDAKAANASARDAHLAREGVKEDLADVIAPAVVRENGEDWGAAVARVKSLKPSAFAPSVAPVVAVNGAGEIGEIGDTADAVIEPVVTPAAALPKGANAARRNDPPQVQSNDTFAERQKRATARAEARRLN